MRNGSASLARHRWRAAALSCALFALLVAGCGSSGQDYSTCGNGRLDDGEQCDDANIDDDDDCTNVCGVARCGDGAVQRGVEECDGTNLGRAPNGPNTCENLGYDGLLPRCDPDCQLDLSPCGAAFTATPDATATATASVTPSAPPTQTLQPTGETTNTPSPTPTPTVAPCGDGLLAPDELCSAAGGGCTECPPLDSRIFTTCAADCAPLACEPTASRVTFDATFLPPLGAEPTSVTVLISYRSNVLSIPGTGTEVDVRRRVRVPPPLPQALSANDLDYALRVVVNRSTPLGSDLLSVELDVCAGAAAPTELDVSCVVQGCAGSAGPISDCQCTLSATSP